VRPGITGLSQVEGYRGEIRNHRMIRNRVVLDIFYIKRWSMWLDLVIILKTIKLVLFGDEKAVKQTLNFFDFLYRDDETEFCN